jgi:hypothetical protein
MQIGILVAAFVQTLLAGGGKGAGLAAARVGLRGEE